MCNQLNAELNTNHSMYTYTVQLYLLDFYLKMHSSSNTNLLKTYCIAFLVVTTPPHSTHLCITLHLVTTNLSLTIISPTVTTSVLVPGLQLSKDKSVFASSYCGLRQTFGMLWEKKSLYTRNLCFLFPLANWKIKLERTTSIRYSKSSSYLYTS